MRRRRSPKALLNLIAVDLVSSEYVGAAGDSGQRRFDVADPVQKFLAGLTARPDAASAFRRVNVVGLLNPRQAAH